MNSIDAHAAFLVHATSESSVSRKNTPVNLDIKANEPVAKDMLSSANKTTDKLSRVSDSLATQHARSSEEIKAVQEQLDSIVLSLNDTMSIRNKTLQFTVDQVSNRVMVTVTDKVSGEIVRQVPSEAILKVAHNIEALKGVIFDKNI